jgi:predicted RNA-binding Zn ribbon-like protein
MIATAQQYREQGFGQPFAWLDLVDSEEWDGFGRRIDHLSDPHWLNIFLRHWDWGVPSLRAKTVPHCQIVQLRALLRRIAEKLASRRRLTADDIAKINAVLNVPCRQHLLQDQNGCRAELEPIHPGWRWLLSRIAASFAEMLAHHRLDHLKICPNSGCRWVFYDRTKGNTRRWCNDRTCGNRDRVRRARSLQKKKSSRPRAASLA